MKPRASMDRTMQSRSRTSTIHQGEMQKQSNQQGKIPGGITVRRDIHAQLSDAQSNLNLTKYLDKLKSGSFPDNLLIVREPWDFAFSRVEVIKNNLIEGGRSCAAAWDEKIGGGYGERLRTHPHPRVRGAPPRQERLYRTPPHENQFIPPVPCFFPRPHSPALPKQ
jgi:hypothetical protein